MFNVYITNTESNQHTAWNFRTNKQLIINVLTFNVVN